MKTKKSEGDFHVALNGIELSEGSRIRIQAAIQKAVMDELAGYPNPDDDDEKPHRGHVDDGLIVVFPKWWWGFILRQVRPNELEGLKGLGPQINSKQYGLQE
jgi:hypothetical protein